LVCLFLAITVPLMPALAQEQAKWFVLRNHEVRNCWTALLIRMDGQYIKMLQPKRAAELPTCRKPPKPRRRLE
jgi:hypothetical protein